MWFSTISYQFRFWGKDKGKTKYSFKYICRSFLFELRGIVVWEKVEKGVRWMPRLLQAMKDVISCEKLWLGANSLWSADLRMGQPGRLKACHPAKREANEGNWNILVPLGRENKNDSLSSGERKGKSPNQLDFGLSGVVGPRDCMKSVRRTLWKERP